MGERVDRATVSSPGGFQNIATNAPQPILGLAWTPVPRLQNVAFITQMILTRKTD